MLTGSWGSQPTQARMSKTLAYFAAFISLGLAGVIIGPTLQGLARPPGRQPERHQHPLSGALAGLHERIVHGRAGL